MYGLWHAYESEGLSEINHQTHSYIRYSLRSDSITFIRLCLKEVRVKETLFAVGGFLLFIILMYVLWLAFVPMQIGQKAVDRQVTQQSQQYVESQRSALLNLNNGYTSTQDEAHRKAIKGQMCDIANKLPKGEVPSAVMSVVSDCL